MDTMFRGIHPIKLDAKFRMRIPGKYSQQLEESGERQLVITIEPNDRCLLLYPPPVWEQLERELVRLPALDPRTRRLQRLLIGHADEVDIDASGRILIARTLREYAYIEKIVNLIGQGRKFEIWAEQLWQENVARWAREANQENEQPSGSDDNLVL